MNPFEPIRSRHRVEDHPESSKVRPHSKTLPSSLLSVSVGGGAAVARAGKDVGPRPGRRGKRVPSALVRSPVSDTLSRSAPDLRSGTRPVLLPMGRVRPASPPPEPASADSPTARDDEGHPSVSPVTRADRSGASAWSLGRVRSPQGAVAPRSPYANPNPGSQSPQLRLQRRLLLAEAAQDPAAALMAATSPQKQDQTEPLQHPSDILRTTPARHPSVSLVQLSPVPPGPAPDHALRLKRLDLDRPVRERDVASRCDTPRFHCPRNVDCMQGSGPHSIAGFCINPDDDNDELDQALSYAVRTQQEELFLDLPALDHEGTLHFRPSAVRSGVATCAVMATDHAAVDSGTLKSSNWVGFTVTVQPLPPQARQVRSRDWRSLHNKMTAPTAEVPAAVADAPVAPAPGLFRPVSIHQLRQQPDEKPSRDNAVFITRALAAVRPLQWLREADSLRDGLLSLAEATVAEDKLRRQAEEAVGEYTLQQLLAGSSRPPTVDAATIQLLERIGKCRFAMGAARYSDAERCFSTAVRCHKGLLQLDPADVHWGSDEWQHRVVADAQADGYGNGLLASMTLLAAFLKHAGRMAAAAECLDDLILFCRTWAGDSEVDPFVLPLLLQQVEVGIARGNAAQALELATIARARVELQAEDIDGDSAADAYNLYGQCCALKGDFTAAQSALQRSVNIHRRIHGATHPSTAESLIPLSRLYCDHGKLEQGIKAAQEAQDIAERKGKGGQQAHIYRTFACEALVCHGQALLAKGKYSLALPAFERARELAAVTGTHSSGYGCFAVALGAFHSSQRRQEAAVRSTEPAVELLASIHGDEHINVAVAEAVLGLALLRKGEPKAAVGLLQHAQQACANLHPTHETLGLVAEVHGDAATALGDHRTALDQYHVAKACVTAGGAEYLRAQRMPKLLERLCNAYCALQRPPPDELVTECADILAAKQREHGEWDFHVTPFLQNLGELNFLRGECDQALQSFVKALKISDSQNMVFLLGNLFRPAAQLDETEIRERNRMASERMSSQGALHFAVILLQIAAVHERQQACAEAEATYLQARAAFEIAGRPNDAGVCAALDGLGRVLFVSGMYGDALSYFHKSLLIIDDHFQEHPQFKEVLAAAEKNIFIVSKKLQQMKYVLHRHTIPGNPHTFPMYI